MMNMKVQFDSSFLHGDQKPYKLVLTKNREVPWSKIDAKCHRINNSLTELYCDIIPQEVIYD